MIIFFAKSECVICHQNLPQFVSERIRGVYCISPHVGQDKWGHLHDLHFDCYVEFLKRTLTSGNEPNCPSCNVVLNYSDIDAFANFTIYKFGVRDEEERLNKDPRDQTFIQNMDQLSKEENIQLMLETTLKYIEEKKLTPYTE